MFMKTKSAGVFFSFVSKWIQLSADHKSAPRTNALKLLGRGCETFEWSKALQFILIMSMKVGGMPTTVRFCSSINTYYVILLFTYFSTQFVQKCWNDWDGVTASKIMHRLSLKWSSDLKRPYLCPYSFNFSGYNTNKYELGEIEATSWEHHNTNKENCTVNN